MREPTWHNLKIEPIDYQGLSYLLGAKKKPVLSSMDEVDPDVRKTLEKLGIPLEEQKLLAGGPRFDAVFDSCLGRDDFRAKLRKSHHFLFVLRA
jgi:Fe-S cluster assembly protein SufB